MILNRGRVFVLGLCFVAFVCAGSVYAIEYGGLLVLPYQSADQPQRSWLVYKDLQSGQVVRDTLIVSNRSPKKLDLTIYAVDAQTTADGAFAPNADDAPRTGFSRWVTLDTDTFSLNPGDSKLVKATIRVPEKVAVGDHVGSIMVREVGAQGLDGGQTGLAVVVRVGVRVYATVAGELVKNLAFEDFTFVIDQSGKPTFHFALANNGNTRLTPKALIKIQNEQGDVVQQFDADLREIFPYSKTIIPVEWKNFQPGTFTAVATISSEAGTTTARDVRFSYGLVSAQVSGVASSAPPLSLPISMWLMIVGFAIIVLLVAIIILLIRKK